MQALMLHASFQIVLLLVAILAGAIAGVSGFGIGSLLTPLLASALGMKLAVAFISIPHLLATALRFWGLRRHVDRRVLIHFGLLSAAGGLLGALFQARANSPMLTLLFGLLLLFVGISALAGWTDRLRFHHGAAWIAGLLSGIFGGLVGNQGGIRSGALLSFQLEPERLVATATAIGILVDFARMPVYLATQAQPLSSLWLPILIATAGCLIGTLWGVRLLARIPRHRYRQALALLICALGLYMSAQAIRSQPQLKPPAPVVAP